MLTQGGLDYLKILVHFWPKVLVDFLHYVSRINCLTGAIISETHTRHKHILITKYDPPQYLFSFWTSDYQFKNLFPFPPVTAKINRRLRTPKHSPVIICCNRNGQLILLSQEEMELRVLEENDTFKRLYPRSLGSQTTTYPSWPLPFSLLLTFTNAFSSVVPILNRILYQWGREHCF